MQIITILPYPSCLLANRYRSIYIYMVLKFLTLVALFFLISCTEVERNNPDDPGSKNYKGNEVASSSSTKSSSSSAVIVSSSSLVVQSSSSATPSSSNCEGFTEGSMNQFCDSRDGKIYKTVKIGNKTWMAENLSYNADGSKCCANQESNCQKYGKLYDWETAVKSCPTGWHLPSEEEWFTLSDAWYKITVEFGYLKDDLGFAALPGGYDASDNGSGDDCIDEGVQGSWWSSTSLGSSIAERWLHPSGWYDISKKVFLCSVRCVRD